MERKESPIHSLDDIRFIDMIAALRKRNRNDEAAELEVTIPLQLALLHNLDIEEILHMKITDVAAFLRLPPKKTEWDYFYYGEAALASDNY